MAGGDASDPASGRSVPPGLREVARQRAALGQDLLRLDAARGFSPQVAGPPTPDARQPESAQSAGALFQRWISELSARHATWTADQLTAAARDLQQQGTGPTIVANFYTDLRTMNLISHAIEERVIAEGLYTEVYSGFQRLSLLRPQTLRYRALLDVAECVCAYGLNDLGNAGLPLRHPRLIPFAVDPSRGTGVEAFWFVVVQHPHLSTALLAQHVAGDLWAATQNSRRYSGFWTFDAALVERIVVALRQAGRILYASA